jgi:hypothetical protein
LIGQAVEAELEQSVPGNVQRVVEITGFPDLDVQDQVVQRQDQHEPEENPEYQLRLLGVGLVLLGGIELERQGHAFAVLIAKIEGPFVAERQGKLE